MQQVRILIADDHPLFRRGVSAMLSSIDHIELVGEAKNGNEAVKLAIQHQPDVILMDIQMPGLNGIEATRNILEKQPDIGVIIVTMFEDDNSVFAAMRAGARGYVLKGADQHDMLRAIEAIANGEALFGPGVASRVMNFFASRTPHPEQEVLPELTAREREILTYITRGYKNPEIAEELVISPKTVRNHISNIFSKLQVTDRIEAIMRAREAGLSDQGRVDIQGK